MLHSFKKRVAKTSAPLRGVNPGGEFLDYKNRLSTIKKNLQYIDMKMDDALRNWVVLMIEQRSFSERLVNGYPISGDDTDAQNKAFCEGARNTYDHFMRNSSPESTTYRKMHLQLKAYIKEISQVESLYGPLLESKSESERYQAKVDAIDRSKRNNDLKKARNLQKMDQEKLRLSEMTTNVLLAQKATYSKAPIVYKAALCAYWTAHETHTHVISRNMEKTSQFARSAEEDLLNLDISQVSIIDNVAAQGSNVLLDSVTSDDVDASMADSESISYQDVRLKLSNVESEKIPEPACM